jgi:hypothetical protein
MASKAAIALKSRETVSPRLDLLTQQYTAFRSFAAMLDAVGGFFPSLRTVSSSPAAECRELTELADAYDAEQAARGDSRRAFRS